MTSSITCVRDFRLDPNSRSMALSSSGTSRRSFSTPANLEVSVPNKRDEVKSLRHLARVASMAETAKDWRATIKKNHIPLEKSFGHDSPRAF